MNIYLANRLPKDNRFGIYVPLTYPSDFWVLYKNLILVDSNFTEANLTLTLGNLPVEYW
jgi:hypothetical protein